MLLTLSASGQDKTLYFLKKVPQSSYINPAYIPEYTKYIGVPLFSGIKASLNSSSFALNDVLKLKNGAASDTLSIDLNRIFDNIKSSNSLHFEVAEDILTAGLKYRKIYFSLNFGVKAFGNLAYPYSIRTLKYGNVDFETMTPQSLNLSDIDINAYAYYETAFGAATKLTDRVRIGGRFKLLSGIMALNTERMQAKLTTSADFSTTNLDADIVLNASAKGLKIEQDKDGYVNKVSLSGSFMRAPYASNLGVGLDFGIDITPSEKVTIAASIVDLGFIRWTADAQRVTAQGSYSFNGINLAPDASGRIDVKEALNAVVDTLKEKFTTTPGAASFSTSLFTKLYVGGTYQLSEKLKAGALLRGALYDKVVDPSATLSLVAEPFKNLTSVLTISYHNRTFNNVGLGISWGTKPIQLYFVTDNLIASFIKNKGFTSPYNDLALIPNKSRSVNFQVGLNIIMGEKTFKLPRRFKSFEYRKGPRS